MSRAGEQFDLFERPRPSIDRRLFERPELIDLGLWIERHVLADDHAPGMRPPRARRGDPESSHRSADEVEGSGRVAEQLRAVLAAVRAAPGSTSLELSRISDPPAGMDQTAWRYAIGRRAPELADRGLVERRIRAGEDMRLWPAGAEIPADAGDRIDDRRRKAS